MPLPQKTFYHDRYLHVTGWTARRTHQRQSVPHGPAVVDPSGTGQTAFPDNRQSYIRSWSPCKLYPVPSAVELSVDDETYAEPNISVICNPGRLTDKGCKGAPDLIIEVVSPSSRRLDYFTKNTWYFDSGIREY